MSTALPFVKGRDEFTAVVAMKGEEGLRRGLVVGLGSQLSAISSYSDATTNVNLRINLQQAALTRIGTINGDVKAATQNNYSIDASGQTVGQHAAAAQFDEILNSLRADH